MNKFAKRLLPLMTLAPFLTACMQQTKDGKPYGFIYEKLVIPTIHSIEALAKVTGSYGLSIILITLVVRLILMPITFSQMKSQMVTQEKMQRVKPEIEALQERMKSAISPEEKMAASQEMSMVYKKYGIKMMGGLGCLPLLLQMPIFVALYNAVRLAPGLEHASFLGIHLGQKNLLLALIAGAIYYWQSQMMTQSIPEEQREQMKMMNLMSPMMIGFFSASSPAALAIYWIAGGLIGVLQTFIQNTYLRPRIKEAIDKEIAENPAFKTPRKTAKAIHPSVKSSQSIPLKLNQGRNRNVKQKRRK
ncbi:membrane protein insertase YidC [Atopobacter sp. AH10]|uniref:membrane protein insertase YidC n=1 Tax=Atopobacter sp. AH10 TaxID=2315861 RepID=UPI000EF1BC86|nr:membrane protein insertase YidC [Atopobacter sp. AH10]RLK63240.1 membrane protein insertase YidC [Atopobacter sp. AH10]